jgi:hypothetical protein
MKTSDRVFRFRLYDHLTDVSKPSNRVYETAMAILALKRPGLPKETNFAGASLPLLPD